MFPSFGLPTNALEFAQWLGAFGYPLGNHVPQGGGGVGTNAAPTFTAPRASGASNAASAHQRTASEPNVPATLQETSLKKALTEGGPGVIDDALEYLDNRGRLDNRALRDFIVSTVVERVDPQACVCFELVLSRLKLTALGLLDEALAQNKLALAESIVKLKPEVVEGRHLSRAASDARELGKTIVAHRPDLEKALPYGLFSLLYNEPSTPSCSRTKSERVESCLDLMKRFPHRADEIASHMEGLGDESLAACALEVAPLPHSVAFWSSALMRFPVAVASSLPVRPEAVDRNLICAAIRYRRHEVLEQACKLKPEVLEEKDHRGDTAAHVAARFVDFKAMEILERCGADMQAKNHMGASPGEVAGSAARLDLLGFVA